jgi:hypothetical protein
LRWASRRKRCGKPACAPAPRAAGRTLRRSDGKQCELHGRHGRTHHLRLGHSLGILPLRMRPRCVLQTAEALFQGYERLSKPSCARRLPPWLAVLHRCPPELGWTRLRAIIKSCVWRAHAASCSTQSPSLQTMPYMTSGKECAARRRGMVTPTGGTPGMPLSPMAVCARAHGLWTSAYSRAEPLRPSG